MTEGEGVCPWMNHRPPMNPPLSDSQEVDVAVIGAGYTGLSAAYHIGKLLPEKKVVVLEAEGAGEGASGRNGGMCLNQPSMDYMSMARPETHRLTYDATAQSITEIAELMKREGLGAGIRICGSLLTNSSETGVERSKDYARKAAGIGVPIEFWNRNQLTEKIGTDVYAGGLYDLNAAEVNPMNFVYALKNAAQNMGVTVFERSPVLRIDEGRPAKLTVTGSDGRRYSVTAETVVLGTNGYTTKLGFFRSKLAVVHVEMAATRQLDDDEISQLGWASRIPFHDDRIYLHHLGVTEDNRIIIGGGNIEYFFNDGLDYTKSLEKRRRALRHELIRIYPGLKDVEFEYAWSGVISFSRDMSQSVGVTGRDGNILYGIGYAGHGVSLAFLFGRVIADIYAGHSDQWRKMPFFQRRMPSLFPPEPLRWLTIKGYGSYLRLKDLTNRR
ncbi:MAG: FAD-dependent oxidoreductase [Methanobacteriota archaeon]|nr:MAG: FAD-dependent oxidoreductase [Euryarchaeota archaeon]